MRQITKENLSNNTTYIVNTIYKISVLLYSIIASYKVFLSGKLVFLGKLSWVIAGYGCLIVIWDLFHKKVYFQKTTIFFAMPITLLCFLSTFANRTNLFSTAKWNMHALLTLFLIMQFPSNFKVETIQRQINIIIKVLVSILTGYLLLAVFVICFHKPTNIHIDGIPAYWGIEKGRLDVFLNPNTLGIYIMLLISFSLCLFFIIRSKLIKILLLLSIALSFYILTLTQSRGAEFSLCLFLFFSAYLWLFQFSQKKHFVIKLVLFGAISSLLAITIWTMMAHIYSSSIYSLTGHDWEARTIISTKTQSISFSSRDKIWKEAFLVIRNNPFLGLGGGGETMKKTISEFHEATSALQSVNGNTHNTILQLALQNGIPFAFICVLYYFITLFKFIRNSLVQHLPKFLIILFSLFLSLSIWGMIESITSGTWSLYLFSFFFLFSIFNYLGNMHIVTHK